MTAVKVASTYIIRLVPESKKNKFRHMIMEYSHEAAPFKYCSRQVQCRGDQERASAISKLLASNEGTILAQASFHKVQARKKSSGHKFVVRSREMLCQGDHERSFNSDVAQYECTLKEQSPVAPSAYLTAP